MERKRLEVALKALTSLSTNQTRTEWVQASCPLAPWTHDKGTDKNPSFAAKLDHSPDPFCNCFSCGAHGPLSEWVQEIAYRNKKNPSGAEYDFKLVIQMIMEAEEEAPLLVDQPSYEEAMMAQPKELVEFPDWWLESFSLAMDFKWARNYLHERGVSTEMAMALDLRADYTQKRICFPIRDFDGTLRGLHGRALDHDTEPRYRMYTYMQTNNPIVWYGEHWIDPSKPIVVVEGPFDVASVMRVYRNVTSPLFANPSNAKIARMADCMEWVTLLDNGKGGDAGRKRIKKALPDHSVTHLTPPGEKDAGDMTEDELRDLLKDHVKLDKSMF